MKGLTGEVDEMGEERGYHYSTVPIMLPSILRYLTTNGEDAVLTPQAPSVWCVAAPWVSGWMTASGGLTARDGKVEGGMGLLCRKVSIGSLVGGGEGEREGVVKLDSCSSPRSSAPHSMW